MKTFNVVIATTGRDTLQRMIDSIAPQLSSRDYLTLIWDSPPIPLELTFKCKIISLINPEPLGYWGHGSRTFWQNSLPGDYLMNGDDDDVYMPDAMEKIRECVKDRKLYLFKMIYGETLFWRKPIIEYANIGTPCGVYPTDVELPEWKFEYGGDYWFYHELAKKLPVEFCDHIIYKIKDA